MHKLGLALLMWVTGTVAASALTFPLPPEDVDVIGEIQYVTIKEGDTLLDIGRQYGVGFEEMRIANPGLDMWVPPEGASAVVPTRFVLPPGPRRGVIVNVPEMRIYFYPKTEPGEQPVVETYPVSIGRMDWNTPIGETRIIQKIKDPTWTPPQSIREEALANGRELPNVVPAGPDNPLGQYAMRLGIPGYLIHGTNKPAGVGMRVTHGCVRMFPEHIEDIFQRVDVNTPVRIINAPFKAGWVAGTLFIEVHPRLEEDFHPEQHDFKPAVETVAAALQGSDHRVDYQMVKRAMLEKLGVPVAISRFESLAEN